MTEKMPCELIQDLLPSYHDKLTSDTTNRIVEGHLSECAVCSDVLKSMNEPTVAERDIQAKDQPPVIDFLRKVRRVERWKIVVACVAVLVLVGIGVRLVQTYIGHDITSEVDEVMISFNDGVLTADGSFTDVNLTVLRAHLEPMSVKNASGQFVDGYYRLRIEGTDFRSNSAHEQVSDFHTEKTIVGDVKAVYLAGGVGIVWSDGKNIAQETKIFYDSVMEEYTLMRQDDVRQTGEVRGSLDQFFEFQTVIGAAETTLNWDGRELTIQMNKAVQHNFELLYTEYAKHYSCALMAGIEKLDSVKFVWVCDEEGRQTQLFTRADANEMAGGDVLEMGSTLAGQQELFEKLNLVYDHWGRYDERLTSRFSVTIETE